MLKLDCIARINKPARALMVTVPTPAATAYCKAFTFANPRCANHLFAIGWRSASALIRILKYLVVIGIYNHKKWALALCIALARAFIKSAYISLTEPQSCILQSIPQM